MDFCWRAIPFAQMDVDLEFVRCVGMRRLQRESSHERRVCAISLLKGIAKCIDSWYCFYCYFTSNFLAKGCSANKNNSLEGKNFCWTKSEQDDQALLGCQELRHGCEGSGSEILLLFSICK